MASRRADVGDSGSSGALAGKKFRTATLQQLKVLWVFDVMIVLRLAHKEVVSGGKRAELVQVSVNALARQNAHLP